MHRPAFTHAFATLALASSLVSARPAAAQGCVSLEVRSCEAWLDVASLARAFEAESGLRTDCAAPAVATLRVQCEGARADVVVNQGAPQGYELATIPASVRSRIVALLLVERLRDASTGAGSSSAQERDEQEPSSASSPEVEDGHEAAQAVLGLDDSPREETPPAALASTQDAPDAPTPEPARASLALAAPTPIGARSWRARAHPLALWVRGPEELEAAGSPRLRVGGEVVVFVGPRTTLAGPVVAVGVGPAQLEFSWSVGTANHALGRTDLALGKVSAGLRAVCARRSSLSICGGLWASVGQARATPRPNGEAVSTDARGPYGALTAELSASLATEWLAFELAARGGYGSGLVLVADGEAFATLGGPFFALSLSLELAPF